MGSAAASDVWRTGCPRVNAMIFNIYISDIPHTVFTDYGYVDDLAQCPSCFPTSVGIRCKKCFLWISKELLIAYLQGGSGWTAKTICTAFDLNNRESISKLAVTVHGTTIPYTYRIQLTLQARLIANSPSGNIWKASLSKSKHVIVSYVSWLAQHELPTPLFCELPRWPWSTVPRNMPPQLHTLRS